MLLDHEQLRCWQVAPSCAAARRCPFETGATAAGAFTEGLEPLWPDRNHDLVGGASAEPENSRPFLGQPLDNTALYIVGSDPTSTRLARRVNC